MRYKHNVSGLLQIGFLVFSVMVICLLLFFRVVSPTLTKAQDTQRVSSLRTLAISIKAHALRRPKQESFFFPTHLELLKALRDGQFPIPKSSNNLCYYIGMTTPQSGEKSQFVILTWGDETSTLRPNNPGILFESSDTGKVEQILPQLPPTIDRAHFACEGKNIPWKNNMSSLLDIHLFPNHWLKINQHQQICMGTSGLERTDQLEECVPL